MWRAHWSIQSIIHKTHQLRSPLRLWNTTKTEQKLYHHQRPWQWRFLSLLSPHHYLHSPFPHKSHRNPSSPTRFLNQSPSPWDSPPPNSPPSSSPPPPPSPSPTWRRRTWRNWWNLGFLVDSLLKISSAPAAGKAPLLGLFCRKAPAKSSSTTATLRSFQHSYIFITFFFDCNYLILLIWIWSFSNVVDANLPRLCILRYGCWYLINSENWCRKKMS